MFRRGTGQTLPGPCSEPPTHWDIGCKTQVHSSPQKQVIRPQEGALICSYSVIWTSTTAHINFTSFASGGPRYDALGCDVYSYTIKTACQTSDPVFICGSLPKTLDKNVHLEEVDFDPDGK